MAASPERIKERQIITPSLTITQRQMSMKLKFVCRMVTLVEKIHDVQQGPMGVMEVSANLNYFEG